MKLFDEFSTDVRNWYELVGFSYALFAFCIAFAPMIIFFIIFFLKGFTKVSNLCFENSLSFVKIILDMVQTKNLRPYKTYKKKTATSWTLF